MAQGLLQPTAIAPLPDGRVLITQKAGQMLIASNGLARTIHTFGTCTDESMGLLGATLDPSFGSNGGVYLYKTNLTSNCTPTGRFDEVWRMTLTGDQLSGGVIFTGIPTDAGKHNGGGLRIGPDGKLYVSTGDTGLGDNAGDAPGQSTNPYARDPNSLAGKVLRLELSGQPAAGNPYPNGVWAIGFRNPFRFGFDPQTGRLWLGDVGQDTLEEIDIVTAGSDYGWPTCEGTLPLSCPPGVVRPAFTYPHTGPDNLGLSPGASVTGGAFAPANFGPYGGQYFFADFVSGNIYRVPLNGARDGFAARPVLFLSGADGPVDIQFGPDGGLYYVAINKGSVRRVGPGTGVGSLTDRTPPRHKIRIRKRQRLSRLNLADTVNEPAKLTVTGTVVSSGASKSKTFRLRKVVRQAQTNRRVRMRLKLRKAQAVSATRLVRRGKRMRVRIKVTGRDAAGNVSTVRRTVRITRP